MPETRINELSEVKADLAAVNNDAALLLHSCSEIAVDEAGECLIV